MGWPSHRPAACRPESPYRPEPRAQSPWPYRSGQAPGSWSRRRRQGLPQRAERVPGPADSAALSCA
jgi:hypothetical protein